jgi:TPR repeat protein
MRQFLIVAVLIVSISLTISICASISDALRTPKPAALSARDLQYLTDHATNGDANAQLSLATDYESGLGVPVNYAEAVRWCRKAADQGNPDAQYRLGRYYAIGLGVPVNYMEAMKWFRKAAAQGNADAQVSLRHLSH